MSPANLRLQRPARRVAAEPSYFDFFIGFRWSISGSMLLQTVLLRQIGSLARTDAGARAPHDRGVWPGHTG